MLELGLLGFTLILNFYDIRHWNYDAGRWETQEEVDAENAEWEAKQKARGN